MIWKVKDINKEQVMLHLPHLIYMSHFWHILLCNQVGHIHNFKFENITTERLLLTFDNYEV